MAKEKSLSTLKVRVNKDGTLSKKSLDEIRKLVEHIKPSIGEKLAGKVTIPAVVEGVGFSGLVGLYWMGFDPLSQILGVLGGPVRKVIADEDGALSILATVALPLTGVAGSLLGTAAVLSIGMDPDAVIRVVEGSAAEEIAILKRRVDGIDGQIELIERGGIGLAVPVEGEFPKFEPAAAERTIKALNVEKARLQDEKKRAVALMNILIRQLFALRVSWSFGMAYITKKFLEHHQVSDIVELAPFQ